MTIGSWDNKIGATLPRQSGRPSVEGTSELMREGEEEETCRGLGEEHSWQVDCKCKGPEAGVSLGCSGRRRPVWLKQHKPGAGGEAGRVSWTRPGRALRP